MNTHLKTSASHMEGDTDAMWRAVTNQLYAHQKTSASDTEEATDAKATVTKNITMKYLVRVLHRGQASEQTMVHGYAGDAFIRLQVLRLAGVCERSTSS